MQAYSEIVTVSLPARPGQQSRGACHRAGVARETPSHPLGWRSGLTSRARGELSSGTRGERDSYRDGWSLQMHSPKPGKIMIDHIKLWLSKAMTDVRHHWLWWICVVLVVVYWSLVLWWADKAGPRCGTCGELYRRCDCGDEPSNRGQR